MHKLVREGSFLLRCVNIARGGNVGIESVNFQKVPRRERSTIRGPPCGLNLRN